MFNVLPRQVGCLVQMYSGEWVRILHIEPNGFYVCELVKDKIGNVVDEKQHLRLQEYQLLPQQY